MYPREVLVETPDCIGSSSTVLEQLVVTSVDERNNTVLSGNLAVWFRDEPAFEKALSVMDRLRATIATIAVGCIAYHCSEL